MTLSILWFILIAVLWIGYLTLEGFDFGVGMILKILGRDERERRATLSTIGPHWDGNEVWLLTAGGATFAAFPEWYSTLFSGAYVVLFIILLCLIVRVCAIEWRPKVNSQTWRDRWDWVHTISAWLPSILWGVAFANLVQGMHIEVVQTSNGAVVPASQVPADSLVPGAAHQITGGLLTMVTPFTLLGGVVTCLLFLNHGALFVALKTTGDLSQRALGMSRRLAPVATVATAAWALWAQLAYSGSSLSWIPLVVAAAGLIGSLLMGRTGKEGRAFALHFVGIAFAVVFIFAAMAPNVMRSSVDPAYSLTIQQAATSRISVESIDPDQGGLHPTLVRDSAQPEAHFGY